MNEPDQRFVRKWTGLLQGGLSPLSGRNEAATTDIERWQDDQETGSGQESSS